MKSILAIFSLTLILTQLTFSQWFWQNTIILDKIIKQPITFKSTTTQLMDSVISTSMTGGGLKLLFEYDSNDKITKQLIGSRINGSDWYYDLMNEYYYDEKQNLILDLRLSLNGSSWDSLNRINYDYNTQGQLAEYTLQKYLVNHWENITRMSFVYDLNGNETQSLSEEWQNGWQKSYLITSYYSNINRRDSLLFQVRNLTKWENYAKTIFSYNQETQFLDYLLAKSWTGVSWENYLSRHITNDQNGNQILQVDQLWNGTSWDNSIRRYYTYDDLNYTLSGYCELWNGTGWYLDDGDLMIENPDGFRIGFLMNNVAIYYKTTGIVDEVNLSVDNFILYQNYPNPFNPSTNIKLWYYTVRFSNTKNL